MRFAWIIVFAVLAGCSSSGGIVPGGMAPASRQFEAPVARVKPAFVSTLASMGMMISAVETRSGREVLKARKGGNEVEIELEAVSRTATRARVTAKSGGMLYDDETATKIMRQAATLLGGT